MKKRAFISVYDKSGIVEFAKKISEQDFEIVSTGGTYKTLDEAGIPVTKIEEITGFPECFSGRVKSMHPLMLGGILFRRGDTDHEAQAQELGVKPIDLVVVNLYPFEETYEKFKGTADGADGPLIAQELIEQIDAGGPCTLRSAAKNFAHVTVVCDPNDYDRVGKDFAERGDTSLQLRFELATKVFRRTAAYDSFIAEVFSHDRTHGMILSDRAELRYGENPHQWGSFYDLYNPLEEKTESWKLHQGKELSYLNLLDADAGWNLVHDFSEPTTACIKHANPSGVASDSDIAEAFQKSYDADPLSAYGVIVALNRPCTKEVIQKIIDQKIFVEVIIAPDYTPDALELLAKRPNLRAISWNKEEGKWKNYRSALGGMLVQKEDDRTVTANDLECVTEKAPTEAEISDLLFAWHACKHARSNAVVFVKDSQTVGIGCGQTSRVDSTHIAVRRAGEKTQGAVMASDAFFPFPDSVEEAASHGITAMIQPGGSIRDEEVIAKANDLGIAMVFTGVRGFKH